MDGSILTRLILATPDSVYFKASSWLTLSAVVLSGLCEVFGKNLGYSKFFNSSSGKNSNRAMVPSRVGMFACYAPAFLAGLTSLVVLVPRRSDDKRFLLLSLALTIHYFKRVFEVIFIHKYSGSMAVDSTFVISLTYFSSTANMIYFHYKLFNTQLHPHENQPQIIDMKYFGAVVFLVGISGNFYHHFILSKLREKGEKNMSYKIPKGGLFGLVICPHYLFEIIGFFGVFFISQTLYALSFSIGIVFYLMGRSYVTRKWYLSKFEDFPKNVKALIPFVL